MKKAIFWDMDGTIADLYNVPNWLDKLRAEDTSPYSEAEPLFSLYDIWVRLETMRSLGAVVGVISWGSKGASAEYNRDVRRAKIDWLKDMNLFSSLDEIHVVKYGTPKHFVVKKEKRGVLVDDNAEVREAWERAGGLAIDPMDGELMEHLDEIIREWMD